MTRRRTEAEIEDGLPYWGANSDVGRNVKFASVRHWVEFPLWALKGSDQ